jgi:SagB-type dehydrogenase family enzyme
VTSQIHQATSLQLAPRNAGAAIPLPPAQAAKAPVRDVIEKRRSQRRFSDQPVPLDALAGILADMAQPQQLSGAIRISLVVSRVQGLAPGVYRYGPGHVLTRVKGGNFAAAARSAALSQQVIGDAAVVLVLSAERGPMLAEGPRGYRHGFLDAGMIGERWLLGATARHLGACPVGAFYDDEAAALIGVDRNREWVLHFGALGIPAS